MGASMLAAAVDPKELLRELLFTCRSLGLGIRDEPMHVPATRIAGGLVRLRGAAVVILDSSAPIPDRIAAVADALCELAVDPLHLSKEARNAIHLARLRRKRQRRTLRMRRQELTSHWKHSRLLRKAPNLPNPPSSSERE